MMEMPLDGAKYDSLLIFTVTGEVKSVEFFFQLHLLSENEF